MLPSHRTSVRTAGVALLLALLPFAALAQAPPELAKADTGPVEFTSDGQASIMAIWRAFGAAHDVDVIFDTKMRDIQLEIRVSGQTLTQALDQLALAARHFWVPVDADTILVANDTPQNRRNYEPQVVRTFRLENMRVADAMTALRSIYGLKHISAMENSNAITFRDIHAKGVLVERLLAQIDVPEDEVQIDLQLITTSEKRWLAMSNQAPSPDQLAALIASGHAESVLRSDLGIVGSRRATVEARERSPESGDQLALTVELAAKVHPQSNEVTLGLESKLMQSKVGARADQGAAASESKGASSTWRVASGEVLLVELPGSLGDGSDVLALALTPKIRRIGSRGAAEALWIGTESTIQAPSTASAPRPTMDGDGTDPLREEVRARLQKRLETLEAKEGGNGGN